MKALSRTLVVLAVVAFTTTAMGQNITNSPHDLTTGSTDGGQNITGLTEICLPCHTPHHADDNGIEGAPLWNHGDTAVSFQMYVTLAGSEGTLNGISKLCLSCHDGVTAMDNYGGATGGSDVMSNTDTIVGGGTGDLTSDHPIGLVYPSTGDYNSASGGKVGVLPLYTVGAEVDRVECASCHNPHDNTNAPFLRVANTSSNLCTTCHAK